MIRLRAQWVFTGDGPPIRNGSVVIEDGLFLSEEEFVGENTIDLGAVALIPGLINTHTHLEFSDLRAPLEPRADFAAWIQQVIASRQSRSISPEESIQTGLREVASTGTAAVGEIATRDWLFQSEIKADRRRIRFYREYLGLRSEQVIPTLAAARKFLDQGQELTPGSVGLSPHAPYSLHPKLFAGLCDLAAEKQVPLTMHLAESPAELQLLSSGTGSLVDLFSRMGIWRDDVIPRQTRPMDYLKRLAGLPHVLLAHGNLLDEQELDFIAEHPEFSIAYCPRTFAAMQSGEHPWRRMHERGINITLGTDSRASNPDLSIWEELRFLQKQAPDVPCSDLLQLATANAGKALAMDRGTIAPGQAADLCVIALPDSFPVKDGFDSQRHLFAGEISKIMLDGEWLNRPIAVNRV